MIYEKYKLNNSNKPRIEQLVEGFDICDPTETKILKQKRILKESEKKYLSKKLQKYLKNYSTLKYTLSREERNLLSTKKKKNEIINLFQALKQKKDNFERRINDEEIKYENLEKKQRDFENGYYNSSFEHNSCQNKTLFFTCSLELYEKEKIILEDKKRKVSSDLKKIQNEYPVVIKEIEKRKNLLKQFQIKFDKTVKRSEKFLKKEFEMELEKINDIFLVHEKHSSVVKRETQKGTLTMLLNMKELLVDEYRKAIGTIEFNYEEELKLMEQNKKEILNLKKKLESSAIKYFEYVSNLLKQKIKIQSLTNKHLNLKKYVYYLNLSYRNFKNKIKQIVVKKNQVENTKRLLESEKKVLDNFISKIQASLKAEEEKIKKNQKKLENSQNVIKNVLLQATEISKVYEEKRRYYENFVRKESELKKKFERIESKKIKLKNEKKLNDNNKKLAEASYNEKKKKLALSQKEIKEKDRELKKIESGIKLVEKNAAKRNELANLKNLQGKCRFKLDKLRIFEKKHVKMEENKRLEFEENLKVLKITNQKFKEAENEHKMVKESIKSNITDLKKSKLEFELCRRKKKNHSTKTVDKNLKEIKLCLVSIKNSRENILSLKSKENSYSVQLKIKLAKIKQQDNYLKNISSIYKKKNSVFVPMEIEFNKKNEELKLLEKELNSERRERKDEIIKMKNKQEKVRSDTEKYFNQKMNALDSLTRSLYKNEILNEHISANSKKKIIFDELRKAEKDFEIESDDLEKPKLELEKLIQKQKSIFAQRSSIEYPNAKHLFENLNYDERLKMDVERDIEFFNEEILQIEERRNQLISISRKLNSQNSKNDKDIGESFKKMNEFKKKINTIEKKISAKRRILEDLAENLLKSLITKKENIEKEKDDIIGVFEQNTNLVRKMRQLNQDQLNRIKAIKKKLL